MKNHLLRRKVKKLERQLKEIEEKANALENQFQYKLQREVFLLMSQQLKAKPRNRRKHDARDEKEWYFVQCYHIIKRQLACKSMTAARPSRMDFNLVAGTPRTGRYPHCKATSPFSNRNKKLYGPPFKKSNRPTLFWKNKQKVLSTIFEKSSSRNPSGRSKKYKQSFRH